MLDQNQSLQRQARQANRYRRFSEQIRQFDAILLHQRWEKAWEALAHACSFPGGVIIYLRLATARQAQPVIKQIPATVLNPRMND